MKSDNKSNFAKYLEYEFGISNVLSN